MCINTDVAENIHSLKFLYLKHGVVAGSIFLNFFLNNFAGGLGTLFPPPSFESVTPIVNLYENQHICIFMITSVGTSDQADCYICL